MRCMCQVCGEYMVQDEKGLDSRCICPQCFHTCSACMGTRQGPASAEELRRILLSRAAEDDRRSDRDEYGD